MLLATGNLSNRDVSLYEAAKIDGGSNWECFWKITLPTIKPMLLLNAIYTVVFLSQDAIISPLIDTIKAALQSVMGYGYAAAFAWMYAIVVLHPRKTVPVLPEYVHTEFLYFLYV